MLSALLALGILTAAVFVFLSNSDDSGKGGGGGGRRELVPVRVRASQSSVHYRRSR